MTALEVAARIAYPDIVIDATFTAGAGVTALFGPSGAGKSTVVGMLAGLRRPDFGRIRIGGAVVFDSSTGVDVAPERRRVGVVFQEDRLFPHLSVENNLLYGWKRRRRAERRTDPGAVVAMLGLGPLLRRRPATLSGGEKQRVAIGRALLSAPRLLLMDEPLASLDAPRRAEILPFLERLRETGIPIVYVSHNVEEVLRLADTMVLLAGGRTEAVGPVEEVLGRMDLAAWTGRDDAGSVFAAEVGVAEDDGLMPLVFPGGVLHVPAAGIVPGRRVRVRIHARDVALALERPARISVLNVFAGAVAEVIPGDGPQVHVLVNAGVPIWARITRRSAAELGIVPGREVFALVKAVAVDRASIAAPLGLARGARAN